MNKEEIEELLEKMKQCDDLHNRCDFLMEHSEITYMLDYITKLQEENQKLKKQLEEKNKPQIFIDTQDIEERYAEGLYQDYLEEENKKYKNQQKEFVEWLESYLKLFDNKDIYEEGYYDCIEEVLLKYKEIIDK